MSTTTKNNNTIKLPTPAIIGGKEVTEVMLREPTVGELQGVKMFDLIQMEVTAVSTVLSRSVTPTPTEQEIANLSSSQFLPLAVGLVGFFEASANLTVKALPAS